MESVLFPHSSPFYHLLLLCALLIPLAAIWPADPVTQRQGKSPGPVVTLTQGCGGGGGVVLAQPLPFRALRFPSWEVDPINLLFLIFQRGEGVINILKLLREGEGIRSHFSLDAEDTRPISTNLYAASMKIFTRKLSQTEKMICLSFHRTDK